MLVMTSDTYQAAPAGPLLTAADLARLLRIHGRRLRGFIRRKVNNPADVDDLVQDTCAEALRCLDRYGGHSRPETWLFGIAVNLVRGHYKRAAARPEFEELPEDGETEGMTSEDPQDIVERMERIRRLAAALDELPASSAVVLMMVFVERLTYEQTACSLQIPVGTVRSRIARARAKLKGGEPDYIQDSDG